MLLGLLLAPALAGLTSLAVQRLCEAGGPTSGTSGAYGAKLKIETLAWQHDEVAGRLRWALAGVTALLVAAALLRFPPLTGLEVSLLVAALMVCAITDLLTYRVPDAVTLPATLLVTALTFVHGGDPLQDAILPAALAAGVFAAVALLTRGGLGFGDVKLAMLIGATLGFPAAAVALGAGILAGGAFVIGLFVTRCITSDQAVPFGPFLALAAVVTLLLAGPAFAR